MLNRILRFLQSLRLSESSSAGQKDGSNGGLSQDKPLGRRDSKELNYSPLKTKVVDDDLVLTHKILYNQKDIESTKLFSPGQD